MKHPIVLSVWISLLISFTSVAKTIDPISMPEWQFKTGDDPAWAKTDVDDTSWETMLSGKAWEDQGHPDYDGMAWFRVRFVLPASFKNQGAFHDTLQIYLGKIDDSDETYLNGVLIGKNGDNVSPDDQTDFLKSSVYYKERYYKIAANSPLLKWDAMNTLAIRVHDGAGKGGMWYGTPAVSMCGMKDYLSAGFENRLEPQADGSAKGFFTLKNKARFTGFDGQLVAKLLNTETKKVESSETINIHLLPGETYCKTHLFPASKSIRRIWEYRFIEQKSHEELVAQQESYYILTPKTPEVPRINGPKITAASTGKPFIFRIPVSGKRPITCTASGLPEGLSLDASTGAISGAVAKAGSYTVQLSASNELGKADRTLIIEIGGKLCLTPPMGWNSWNCWGLSVSESKMRSTVDCFLSAGLADHGWSYVNIDDGWQAPARTSDGEITPNERFGNMNELSDYVHSKGLKLGIYSSPGTLTCGGYLGSYQHEQQDVNTYVKWGVDYLKYDWCSYNNICPLETPNKEDLKKPYIQMQKLLSGASRDIVHSLCQYGVGNVWEWGEQLGGQLWRTTGDINDSWSSMSNIGFNQQAAAPYAGPGHWNDPDMLVVGHVGWGPSLHPTHLTPSEQYTHISLWSLLSAPLLIGCDLSALDEFTLSLLTNDEVIAIDQDPLGIEAVPVYKDKDYAIYTKKLENGSLAVGLFNLTEVDRMVSADWSLLHLYGKKAVRDVWRQKDLGLFEDGYQTTVPAHGVALLRID